MTGARTRLAVPLAVPLAVLLAVVLVAGGAPIASPVGAAAPRLCVTTSAVALATSAPPQPTVVATLDGGGWALPHPVGTWSPDRRRAAFLGSNSSGNPTGALRIATTGSPRSTVLVDLQTRGLWPSASVPIEWSPDGRRIAVVARQPPSMLDGLWVVEVSTGRTSRVSRNGQAVVNSIAWAPDSRSIYYGASAVVIGGTVDTTAADVWVAPVSASGQPKRIIATSYVPAGSYPLGTRFDPPAAIDDLAVSPDGTRLAFTGYDFQGRNVLSDDLWVADTDGSGVEMIADNSAGQTSHSAPRWSPNSRQLAVSLSGVEEDAGVNGLGVFDVPTDRFVRVSRTGRTMSIPAWSPDGMQVAFAADRSVNVTVDDVFVLDVRSGRRTRVIAADDTSIRDGRVVWVRCLTAPPLCGGKRATIIGTGRADTITGTEKADVIVGLGGDDRINAGAGNDTVCGGPGKDIISGGPGTDRLFADGRTDVLDGGPGKDRCVGGATRRNCE
jgi:Tol biopolymer transport system component